MTNSVLRSWAQQRLGQARAVARVAQSALAGEEDFVTAVFAELDPRGWLQMVVCGHPPPLRLNDAGELETLAPSAFATPLGMHPDLHLSTYSVRTVELTSTESADKTRAVVGLSWRRPASLV